MSDYELLNREVELKDRTPVTQAVEIIMILDGMWLTDFVNDMTHKNVLNHVLSAESVDGVAAKESLLNWSNYDYKLAYAGLLFVIYSYCAQAIREYMDNDEVPTNLAWAYIGEAWRELSALDYARTRLAIEKQIPDLIQSEIKKRASKAGKAAHANTYKQKIKMEVEQKFKDSAYPFHVRGHTTKFVKEMHEQYTDQIENIKTIERWVADLKKKKQQ